jgi:cytochrome P450
MSAFERLFSAQGAGTAARSTLQSNPNSVAVVAAALAGALLAAAALSRFLAGLLAFLRVRRGLRGIPRAPGGSPLLGHVLPLMRGTPWDVMEDWVRETSAFAKGGGGGKESSLSTSSSTSTSTSSSSPTSSSSSSSSPSAIPPADASLGPACPEGMCVATVGHRKLLVVGSAPAAREIFQTKARRFSKDLDFSFKPFLPILGTGLVTASGSLWRAQRLLIAPALRVDILESVPRIAVAAAERLARKLERALADEKARNEGEAATAAAAVVAVAAAEEENEKEEANGSKAASVRTRGDVSPASVMLSPASRAGSAASLAAAETAAAAGTAATNNNNTTTNTTNDKSTSTPLSSLSGVEAVVDMEEEFRLLTLQIIGEAVLSLPPEECDRVFPELYLPVMEEANLRALRPWRSLVPGEARRKYARGIKALDAYIRALLRERWAERKERSKREGKGASDDGNKDKASSSSSSSSTSASTSTSSPIPEARDDILETMLAAIEHRGEEWSSSLETQLCFEVKTFLLAGHETSAAMLTWSLYELGRGDSRLLENAKEEGVVTGLGLRDPGAAAALARVRKEAETVLKLSPCPLKSPPPLIPSRQQAEDGFDFSLACLKESLRKYSVVPVVTRVAAEDTSLCGRKVPKGTYVAICIQAVHNNTVRALGGWKSPFSWFPERFLAGGEAETMPDSALVEREREKEKEKESPTAKKGGLTATTSSTKSDDDDDDGGIAEKDSLELVEGLRTFNYLPFIQGPRNCLGQYFALLEARIVLARLVAGFDFTKATPGEARRHPAVIPTGPEGGMPMLVRLRK